MASLRVTGLVKTFSGAIAVDNVSLDLSAGEFFSVLGPSGCGKTTLLRMIAGFETPDHGRIELDGKDITVLPPQDRNIGMVFQNYALFPNMTVFDNVAFGLRMRRVSSADIALRVEKMLDAVGLQRKEKALVPTLSGGEQQRVAVARALVMEPSLLLFDEPLSNLDVGLRLQTREKIRDLQRKVSITSLYVTHDQAEAMSLSHRIGVMQAGVLIQIGRPDEVYHSPATPFIAGFLGGAVLLRGSVTGTGSLFRGRGFEIAVPREMGVKDGDASLAVKPEAVLVAPRDADGIPGRLLDMEYLGFTTTARITMGEEVIRVASVSSSATKWWHAGADVTVTLDWAGCFFFPA